jgi:hypothetical protein
MLTRPSSYTDPNWQPFTLDSPSWLVFEDGGKMENESLAGFEEGMIDWSGRGKGKTGDEGEGDLLGVSSEARCAERLELTFLSLCRRRTNRDAAE